MGFSLEVYGFPVLRSYADAVKRWEATTPIRGRKEDTRPLGPRSKTHALIGKDDYTGDIFVQLHRTRVVTYHKDGKITINTGGWNTTSTFALINHVAPWGLWLHNYGGAVWLTAYHGDDHTAGYFWMHSEQMTFEPREDATGREYWHILDPKPFPRKRINRKRMAELRRRFKDLYSYVDGYIKLMWTDYDGPGCARIRQEDLIGFGYLRHPPEPTDDPEVLRVYMLRAAQAYSARKYCFAGNNPKLDGMSSVCIARAHIDKLLRNQFPDIAYVTEELPLGKRGKNAY